MNKYVVVLATDGQGKVLLVEKNRPAWQKGCLNLPGGKIESGEDEYQAALRELKEESGLSPIGVPPRDVTLMGGIIGNSSYIYCLRVDVDAELPLSPREGETEKVQWYEWVNVWTDKRLMPNLRVIVPLMLTGVSAWFVRDPGPIKGRHEHEIGVKLLFGYPITVGEEI